MRPGARIAHRALARKRIGRLGERQLRNNHAFQCGTGGIEAFPEALQGEQRQVLVFQEVVSQAFRGNAPFLTYEPQPRFFQRGVDRAETFFHFATIREQREHASVLRKMRLRKEIFERFQVARLIGTEYR